MATMVNDMAAMTLQSRALKSLFVQSIIIILLVSITDLLISAVKIMIELSNLKDDGLHKQKVGHERGLKLDTLICHSPSVGNA